ncbi:deoxyribonuclease IV [Alkalibaculum sp. M08DMB]|uniref:Probable endonuclease 4 n=1 Tax=Alkalibaculum sporogenes TaxID=2655001 RepID=A0A6A7K6E9_9FIRM|nr:deoxyribonuclease IV [Alkalibaculum sporogenes]
MLYIGSHLSISKGFFAAGKDALSIGANTFQFFTRNPRGGKAKKLDLDDIYKFKELMDENHFGPLLAHAPYTLNMCSNTEKTRDFAKMIFADDLERLQSIPCNLYNFHPGSHVGQGVEKGIELIVDILNDVLKVEHNTTILLELMSGKGSEVGTNFEEVKEIIDRVSLKEKMGVCLDTCHIYSAGYDIVNNLDDVIDEFDSIIGLDVLKAIHLNDSKYPLGTFKDRHEVIGEGHLGLKSIIEIVNHPKLKNIPFFLETPNELEGHAKEIQMIKENYND